MSNATVWAAFEVLHSASLPQQQNRQNRFCNIEPSLVTDSSEASKDGREASGDSFDVGGHGAPGSLLRCGCDWSRARCGAAAGSSTRPKGLQNTKHNGRRRQRERAVPAAG